MRQSEIAAVIERDLLRADGAQWSSKSSTQCCCAAICTIFATAIMAWTNDARFVSKAHKLTVSRFVADLR